MHTLNRLVTLCLLLVVLLPAGTGALLTLDDKAEVSYSLQTAINNAARSYRSRASLQSARTKGEMEIDEQTRKLERIREARRALRAEMIAVKRTIDRFHARYNVRFGTSEEARARLREEKTRLSTLVKLSYTRRLEHLAAAADDETRWAETMLRNGGHLAANTVTDIDAVIDAHLRFARDLEQVRGALLRMDELRKRRDDLSEEGAIAQGDYDEASALVEVTSEQMDEIKAIMADVHAQVLKLQSEMARIDARLRSKAERSLIEKGLLDPKEAGTATGGPAKRPQFLWPVYGPVSAGFHNDSYQKHFGVPHYGTDIVVGESSPVYSAADGIVFLVRDGGEKGYTYVLVGHRNGYATLYGHLLSVSVESGQEIAAGGLIGFSGGRPGTPGAGPMTTGAHLHFEVIQHGTNIDPLSVLPSIE